MSTRIQRLILGAALFVFVVAAWYAWPSGSGFSEPNEVPAVATGGAPTSTAAASSVALVAPQPQPSQMKQAASESKVQGQQNLVLTMSSIVPPQRPASEIVTLYRSLRGASVEAQAEVFQALSYCANTKPSTAVLRGLRAEGSANDPAVGSLETTVQAHTAHCSRLSSADYAIRSEIASALARQGDVFAMQAFYEVGPTGDGHGSFESMSRESAQSWLQSAIGFLQIAVNQGSVASLSTLSSIYAARSADPVPSTLSSTLATVQDPVAAYAYQFAFAHQVGKTDLSRARLLNAVSIALSPEQLQVAQSKGNEILQQCCLKK
jgi:hypothetical protein